MEGKLIIVAVFFLIVVLVIFLFHDSDFFESVKAFKERAVRKIKEVKELKEVELANEPILLIRESEDQEYYYVEVHKNKFSIGRGRKNSLVLESKKIEEKHAIIYKRLKNNYVYYELINFSRNNPIEYFNKQKVKYEYLGYKDGVKLDNHEVFYLGDIKMQVVIPLLTHEPSKTEMIDV